jgi:hypothetical protein
VLDDEGNTTTLQQFSQFFYSYLRLILFLTAAGQLPIARDWIVSELLLLNRQLTNHTWCVDAPFGGL